jgi:UDP-N-acetylmuramoyl-tripeptide--D-alanyl-D-alanine ligase
MKHLFKAAIVRILIWEARIAIRRYKPHIVGVTGSVGKTSTKDAVYACLAGSFFTRKSEKSFNSEIGVPLTVLGLPNAWSNPLRWIENVITGFWIATLAPKKKYPRWLVLEIGADHPGDIERLTSWLPLDVGVITRIGSVPVHVEFYKSQKELVLEKSFIAKAVKASGILVLNADDADVLEMRSFAPGRTVTVGVENENVDFLASHYALNYSSEKLERPIGFSFRIDFKGNSLPLKRAGIIGRQHMYPTAIAAAVALSLGVKPLDIEKALDTEKLAPGRMRLIEGKKGATLIDDSYNASPIALGEALNALKETRAARKIAILGDMMELGKFSAEEHLKAGKKAGEIVNLLITVGVRSRAIADGAQDGGLSEMQIKQFDTSIEAGAYVEDILQEGDIVLVKGSQSMRMERAVLEMMATPEDAPKLLVRQDEEWQVR